MSKGLVLNYFRLYPTKINGFTINEIAKASMLSYTRVKNVIMRFRREGKIEKIRGGRGRGRGRGREISVYRFTAMGKRYLAKKGNNYIII
ncbi:MAG: hypothetical protein QXO37_09525 [Candidatus Nitrosocaldaceae archaeon]